MNMALIIILGELFLVMVVFLIGFGIATWRRKKKLKIALDTLIKDIEKRRPERHENLLNRLQNDYGFDDTKAVETSNELLRTENGFLKKLFALQFTQDSTAIATLGGNLHELLDQYFDLVPLDNAAVNLESAQTVESDIQSEAADSTPKVSPESDPEIAAAQTEADNSESATEEDQTKEPDAVNQPGQEVSEKPNEDLESTLEETIEEVSVSTDTTIEPDKDSEKSASEDKSSELEDNSESNSDSPIEEVASVDVSGQTVSQSEPEPNWDDAFAEIETLEPETEEDSSKKEEADATLE